MHMMLLFHIIAVLLIASTTVADDSGPDPAQAKFIEQLNEERRRIAKEDKIKNMHKLVYDQNLALLAEKMKLKGETEWEKTSGFNEKWRYIYFTTYQKGVTELIRHYNLQKGLGHTSDKSTRFLDPMVPLQRQIGCAEAHDEYPIVLCLLGPVGSTKSWFNRTTKKCPKGYQNIDDLCTPKSELYKEYGDQLKFIADLNEKRREIANKYNSSNMHKLVFHENLLKTAQAYINGNKKGLHKDWRYTRIKKYEDGAQKLDKKFNGFMKKGGNFQEKSEKLEKDNGYVEPLEHAVPLQTWIAWAEDPKAKGNMPKIVCALASEGSLDSSFGVRGVPGTDCFKGYTNVRGLCVLDNDSEVISLTEVVTIPSENTTPVPDDSSNPSSKDSTNVANTTVAPVTKYFYVRETTVETELDRLIAKYKREEKEGDLPIGEEEMEEDGAALNFSVMVSVIFVFLRVA